MGKDKKKEKNDKNIVLEVDGDQLSITVDLSQELGESQSGNSMIIANTGNFMNIPDTEDDYQYGLKLIVTRREARKKKENK